MSTMSPLFFLVFVIQLMIIPINGGEKIDKWISRISQATNSAYNVIDEISDIPDMIKGIYSSNGAFWFWFEYGWTSFVALNEKIRSSDWSCDDEAKPDDADISECLNDYYFKNYRTLTGKCNNLDYPLEGSVGQHFNRIGRNYKEYLPQESEIENNLYDPNPYEIAKALLHRKDEDGEEEEDIVPHVNALIGVWAHFIVHDQIGHELYDIDDNPHEINTDDISMRIPRQKESNSQIPGCPYKNFRNTQTAYFDASQIYGVNEEVHNKLMDENDDRKFKLEYISKYDEYQIPFDIENNEYIVGARDNFWTGLNIFHLLFAQEHNYIIDELDKLYPDIDSIEIYHIARLIISAFIAKTHATELIMAAGSDGSVKKLIENKHVQDYFDENFIFNNSENFPFKFDHWLKLTDLLSQKMEPHIPFQKTEMFSSMYNFHSVLRENLYFSSYLDDDANNIEKIKLADTFFMENTRNINNKYSMKDILYSFGTLNNPSPMRLNSYPPSLTKFKTEDGNIYDLATTDLLRNREKGLPKYTTMRKILNLKEITSYRQLTDDEELIKTLNSFYDTIDDMDLLIGMRLENTHSFVSETAIWGLIHSDLFKMNNDRFFNQKFNVDTYTPFGLNYLSVTSLKDVIIRHYPELKDKIHPKNALLPWNNRRKTADIVADDKYNVDIIQYIKQNQKIGYWLDEILDIKLDSIQSVQQLLDTIFNNLSDNNLMHKVKYYADKNEEIGYWLYKLLYLDSIDDLSQFLDIILDRLSNDNLKDKFVEEHYKELIEKLKQISHRIRDVNISGDSKENRKPLHSIYTDKDKVIVLLLAVNLIVITLLIIYCCIQNTKNRYRYQKVSYIASSDDEKYDNKI